MTIRIGTAAVAALLALGTAALADEPFGTDVWLASPRLCEEAKAAGSLQKTLDDGNLVLSAKGLRGADFTCHFIQTLKAPDVEAWVATALCRQEGAGDFPNMYSISKGADGRLTLVTVYDDEEPAAEPGDEADPSQGDETEPAQGEEADPAPGAGAPDSTVPATPPVASQPDADGGAAAAQADAPAGDGTASEDASAGDVYSRCQGIAAP